MNKIKFKDKLSQHYVKILLVEEHKSKKNELYYEVQTDNMPIYLFGSSGRMNAKILKEEFEGNNRLAILYGYIYERKSYDKKRTIMPHPYMPFILNSQDRREK